MKTLLRLLACFCVITCVASASAALSPVSFVLGKQSFKPGDAIVIDQVLATSARLEVGTKLLVRGHYTLASCDKANVGLYLTHRSPAGADASTRSQTARLEQASGTFELSCDITYAGDPHVSLYPAKGGEAFGGVYFAAAP